MKRIAIERYIGKPFVDRGRGPDGYDCWGLVRAVLTAAGVRDVPDYALSFADREGVVREMATGQCRFRALAGPEPGAIVALAAPGAPGGRVNHVGVVVDGRRFLHTTGRTGAVLERLDAPMWRKRIRGYYACPEE